MKSPDSTRRLLLLSILYCACAVTAEKEVRHNGDQSGVETLEWAVKLNFDDVTKADYDIIADLLAKDLGLKNKGQIGALEGIYLFSHPFHENYRQLDKAAENLDKFDNLDNLVVRPKLSSLLKERDRDRVVKELRDRGLGKKDFQRLKRLVHEAFDGHDHVQWFSQQVLQRRVPRSLQRVHFRDPQYHNQWHLKNRRVKGNDINVTGVWEHNITGRGVTVSLIDDGVQWNNPDIEANYNPAGSYDLNSEDEDPMPHPQLATNGHGTRCAGEIAAVPNSVCGVGVAYGAKVSGIRALDGPITDQLEAKAFTIKLQVNDIFSCSWGPDDDGRTVDGPRAVARAALKHGINTGRHGYGTIYVVASGNGGRYTDNCNYDGYANSIYTVTIGAVDENIQIPYYAESCATILAVTYSSGSIGRDRSIVTTDWTFRGATGCTDKHSGTSAAAPIGAGMIALMLEARPCLTWRDVQHIIAVTSVPVDKASGAWSRNAAGLRHSHQHGFGLMDAWRLVTAARVWNLVPFQTSFHGPEVYVQQTIPLHTRELRSDLTISESMLASHALRSLEHIVISVTATHKRRGYIEIRFRCPSGTESVLAAPRHADTSSAGFHAWPFSTLRCWGESPVGTYTLIATQRSPLDRYGEGTLMKWSVILYGSPLSPPEFRQRVVDAEKAYRWFCVFSGYPLVQNNLSLPCSAPPPILSDATHPISDRTLKPVDSSASSARVLALVSGFCLLFAVYETFEYMCCFETEKRETMRNMRIAAHMQVIASEREANNDADQTEDDDVTDENTPMLLSTNHTTTSSSRPSSLSNHITANMDTSVTNSVIGSNRDDVTVLSQELSAVNR